MRSSRDAPTGTPSYAEYEFITEPRPASAMVASNGRA